MRKIFSGSHIAGLSGMALAFFLLFTLVSCEKEVNINLDSGEPRLVVEGSIETGLPPYVLLTKSIGYFSTIDYNALQNSFVHGAKVTVSDGSITIELKEYTIADTSGSGGSFSFYTVDTSAGGNWLVGELEKTYKLRIEYEGKVYESSTKIPTPTQLDSVVTAIPTFVPDKNPGAKHIRIYFKDPDTLGNAVRYYTQRKNQPFYPGLNSVFNDELINGAPFTTELSVGESRTGTNFDSLGYVYTGDTVVLKWCAIDKATYNYWNTYEYSLGTIGSPFASPIQVMTNINNNALGIWAGYGSLYYTVIIK